MSEVMLITSTKQNREDFSKAMIHESIINYDIKALPIASIVDHTGPIADAYNRYLSADYLDKYLVFMHADSQIKAPKLEQELEEAFLLYDVIGVAGSTKEFPEDVSWFFTVKEHHVMRKDPMYLSGNVFHTDPRCYGPSFFGPAPQPCEMLDGVFLAVNGATVIPTGIRFDPQFKYDFYDLDFCRQARAVGLRLGTWPFKLTHASGGRFGSLEWQAALKLYKSKWNSS